MPTDNWSKNKERAAYNVSHLNLKNKLNILCYLEHLVLMLFLNLYVSIFTGFVMSNLLIVIIPTDFKLFILKLMYLFIFFFIYVLIYCIFIYLFTYLLDCYNFYSNCNYIK